MDDLASIDAHWIWLTIGLALAALELLVPGVYLIWLAVAAFLTGAITFALDPSLPIQIVSFTVLSLITAYAANRFYIEQPIASSDPHMNNRGARLTGQTATVVQAIEEGGTGRVRVGDGEWLADGPPLAAGARVRITGHAGAVLRVEPLVLQAPVDPGDVARRRLEDGGDEA